MPLGFTPGQSPTGAQWNVGLPLRAFKPIDTSVNTTTTIAADPDLFVAVNALVEYEFDLLLIYTQGTLAQLTFGWTAPASSSLDWFPLGLDVTVTASQTGSIRAVPQTLGSTQTFGGNSSATTCRASGRLVTSSTPGNLALRWGPSVSNATPTVVKAGSYLVVRQIA